MAKSFNFFNLLPLLLLLLHGFTTEARPFSFLEPNRPRIWDKGFFDGLGLGAIKQSGPSPGQGNKHADSHIFGGIKSGPSPGQGNKYTDSHTFGGIKDGPSPGQGH